MSSVTRKNRSQPGPSQDASLRTPRLDNGDHLTGEEFDKRYEAMPGIRAELIEGVVFMASPVSLDHGESHADLTTWAGTYRALTPGVGVSSDGSVYLDPDNRPQPDVHVKILPNYGGRTGLTEDGKYVVGAPEMVIEIAISTASNDLHTKKRTYRRNQVREYLVWRVENQRIDWFVLREGRYVRMKPTAEGLLKSDVFPGLWLDPAAAIRGDLATVLQVLQQGLASPEHAAFVARLQDNAVRLAAAAAPNPEAPRP
ncbi:MAG: hypothetical protein JWN86_3191 [Planctomycetota bacterium]|nr:hypothetical protein [Planctomycetota bacterium]